MRYRLAFCVICSLPGALVAGEEATIVYQPDIVAAGRIFLVALSVPPQAAALEVDYPDSIEMIDRTPLPTASEVRKYYFRALSPSPRAEIVFGHSQGRIVVPVTIWSFEDLCAFRELYGVQLPRRWPLGEELPELKQGQTVTTQASRQAAAGAEEAASHWLELSDEQIWQMQPDCTIPRWHWVNLQQGCPQHGTQIYSVRPYYPWVHDTSVPYPWKVRCPVGGELYPSNDFASGDMTSGPFPDDGIGGAAARGSTSTVSWRRCARCTAPPFCACPPSARKPTSRPAMRDTCTRRWSPWPA